jgi:two-component system response regulator FixJ
MLLDLRMPDMSGFDVLEALADNKFVWPVVVMTGHGEVSSVVRAMRLGAFNFIEKPFSEAVILTALEEADVALQTSAHTVQERHEATKRVQSLTPRELNILQGLLGGLSNKGISSHLGTSSRTVELQRASMMNRLGVRTVAQAVRLAVLTGIDPLD